MTIYPDFVEKQKDTSSATCDVSAPKEKIQWFHAGEEIEEGENYDIHGENNTLTIRNMGSFVVLTFKVHTRAVPVVIGNGLRAAPARR